jgi:hypothetical protein
MLPRLKSGTSAPASRAQILLGLENTHAQHHSASSCRPPTGLAWDAQRPRPGLQYAAQRFNELRRRFDSRRPREGLFTLLVLPGELFPGTGNHDFKQQPSRPWFSSVSACLERFEGTESAARGYSHLKRTGLRSCALSPRHERRGTSRFLIAPAGIVDAGEAGIGASGNLNIAQTSRLRGGDRHSDHSAIPITRRPNTVALTMASKPTGRLRRRQR